MCEQPQSDSKSHARKRGQKLTFDADNLVPDFLRQVRFLHQLDQIVDCVDTRMDTLEPLNLFSDGLRV